MSDEETYHVSAPRRRRTSVNSDVWKDSQGPDVPVGMVFYDPTLPYGEHYGATLHPTPFYEHPKTRFFKSMKGAVNWIVRKDLGS